MTCKINYMNDKSYLSYADFVDLKMCYIKVCQVFRQPEKVNRLPEISIDG
ncbi:MAG: hypothetical protein IKG79_02015 [Neisseriaceae bacterium]|nr:hypothetical protein [Neisseriaceae bacterium]